MRGLRAGPRRPRSLCKGPPPRATRPRGALASCRPPVLEHSPLPESTKRGQPAPHAPHPPGTWNPRDTAPACASLLDPIRTCRGHSRPHVSVPVAADQLPPGPSTAPPANRAPGCDSEADAAPVPRGNRFANSERGRMPASGEKLGLRNLRTPGQPARQSAPQTCPGGNGGVQTSGCLWTGKRNWWLGRPQEAAPTNGLHAAGGAV